MVVWEVAEDGRLWRPAPASFRAWREHARSFESLATFQGATFTLSGEGEPTSLAGARVSAGFFELLGVSPLLGRGFLPDEGKAGAPAERRALRGGPPRTPARPARNDVGRSRVQPSARSAVDRGWRSGALVGRARGRPLAGLVPGRQRGLLPHRRRSDPRRTRLRCDRRREPSGRRDRQRGLRARQLPGWTGRRALPRIERRRVLVGGRASDPIRDRRRRGEREVPGPRQGGRPGLLPFGAAVPDRGHADGRARLRRNVLAAGNPPRSRPRPAAARRIDDAPHLRRGARSLAPEHAAHARLRRDRGRAWRCSASTGSCPTSSRSAAASSRSAWRSAPAARTSSRRVLAETVPARRGRGRPGNRGRARARARPLGRPVRRRSPRSGLPRRPPALCGDFPRAVCRPGAPPELLRTKC